MQYLISHRGNIDGKNPERENHPSYIIEALQSGFDVEIDLIMVNKKLYLGHDKPQYDFDANFFGGYYSRLWLHTKNYDAFRYFVQETDGNCFYHTNENWVLTSKGYIWAYPGKEQPGSICVLPELNDYPKELLQRVGCIGVCSDEIGKWRE